MLNRTSTYCTYMYALYLYCTLYTYMYNFTLARHEPPTAYAGCIPSQVILPPREYMYSSAHVCICLMVYGKIKKSDMLE